MVVNSMILWGLWSKLRGLPTFWVTSPSVMPAMVLFFQITNLVPHWHSWFPTWLFYHPLGPYNDVNSVSCSFSISWKPLSIYWSLFCGLTWSVLQNFVCAFGKNVYFAAFGWCVLKMSIKFIWSNVLFKASVSLSVFFWVTYALMAIGC